MALRDEPAPVLPLPMFPLGTVLFPHMPLPLHVFEMRYRQLTRDCLRSGREFGVVLIERGSEVGGGESRFSVGTVARIVTEAEFPDGRWALVARGEERIRVQTWLPDDPYPLALVERVRDPGTWVEPAKLTECEPLVRRALALAAELDLAGEMPALTPATFRLSPEPLVAAWQLCAALPSGPADRQRLLEAEDGSRLDLLAGLAREASELFAYRLGGR